MKKMSKSLTIDKVPEKQEATAEAEVYDISSGDDDCSNGMTKWIMRHRQSMLQESIDDFIIAHEAQEEQARKEREAEAAKDGFTVVVHHRGRKKTTDAESGIAVGSVAPEDVLDNMANKKNKDVGLDIYGFHGGEARRSEVMMLQSKFVQDKKRIQQLRAARKFAESGIAVGSVAPAAVLDNVANKKNKDVGLDFYPFHKREAPRIELMMLQSKFEQDKKRIQQLRAARKFHPY